MARLVHAGVADLALHPEGPGMELMGEGDGLLGGIALGEAVGCVNQPTLRTVASTATAAAGRTKRKAWSNRCMHNP
ncbi:MAG: hypothetical protein IPN91_11360 [Holophagaceae bacterium]|uniref:Uncharacterized protein n=1 Tax=Candidatus Geothrix odensensis TaxID=2954440 RepID=A0A936F3W2_9BACT|nr:hypothetical protein [Candidatus Geothrix odensensis]